MKKEYLSGGKKYFIKTKFFSLRYFDGGRISMPKINTDGKRDE